MAEKIEKNVLNGSLVFKQNGKVVDGEPTRGVYNVYPVKGSAISIISGADIVKALKANYPTCEFNFFARPVIEAKQAKELK